MMPMYGLMLMEICDSVVSYEAARRFSYRFATEICYFNSHDHSVSIHPSQVETTNRKQHFTKPPHNKFSTTHSHRFVQGFPLTDFYELFQLFSFFIYYEGI